MNRAEFEKVVEQALESVPPVIRQALKNIVIMIEERPSLEDVEEIGLGRDTYLFGLFRGVPITGRSFFERGGNLPNQIILYKGELEDCCPSRRDLIRQISLTLIHEIGHYLGLSEKELRRLEAEATARPQRVR
jgi:predicted Zn-dependent protease with MMP-like domain